MGSSMDSSMVSRVRREQSVKGRRLRHRAERHGERQRCSLGSVIEKLEGQQQLSRHALAQHGEQQRRRVNVVSSGRAAWIPRQGRRTRSAAAVQLRASKKQ